MAELFFIVKTFLFTIALVVVMQIRIGNSTIEERSHEWIQNSAIHRTLGKVALGAVTVMKDGVAYAQDWFKGSDASMSASTAER